ncbi:MAG: hypothetical protein N2578_04980, partial [Bdellovibrionaceae bacterium]|nr:hypothetical protein [Pseudobdellovibrionaceae bacterium]
YGPDINLGLPREFMDTLDLKDFERKVNYYAPALAAMTVASPFVNGQPWNYSFGRTGKSYRMHKRSYIAPPIEIHPHEGNRLEFKVFDMPSSLKEIEAQFLSFIALVFSENLRGRADNQSRIYELGDVAKKGLAAEGIREKLEDFFQFAEPTLESLGFDPSALSIFHSRLETGRTPADEMLSLWEGGGMLAVLEARRELH